MTQEADIKGAGSLKKETSVWQQIPEKRAVYLTKLYKQASGNMEQILGSDHTWQTPLDIMTTKTVLFVLFLASIAICSSSRKFFTRTNLSVVMLQLV